MLGVAIVRALPDPGPASGLPAELLGTIPLRLRAVFAAGRVDAGAFAHWQRGEIVPLATPVGAPARLEIGGRPFALGSPAHRVRAPRCVIDAAAGARA